MAWAVQAPSNFFLFLQLHAHAQHGWYEPPALSAPPTLGDAIAVPDAFMFWRICSNIGGSSGTVIVRCQPSFLLPAAPLAVSIVCLSLSVVIITLNEEANLPRTLESVKWADEIVVLDSGSTDRTREIAESFGQSFSSSRGRALRRRRIPRCRRRPATGFCPSTPTRKWSQR